MYSNTFLLFAVPFIAEIVAGAPVAMPDEDQLVNITARGDPAAPVNFGSSASFSTFEIDVSGWKTQAEQDCAAMLCDPEGVFEKDDPTKFQRADPATHDKNRGAEGSAYNSITFPRTPQSGRVSGEEWPPASVMQGGEGAYVMPGDSNEQRRQGGSMSAILPKIAYLDWFRLKFTSYFSDGYCEALFSNPPNKNVCNPDKEVLVLLPDGKTKFDPKKYMFRKIPGTGGKGKQPAAFEDVSLSDKFDDGQPGSSKNP